MRTVVQRVSFATVAVDGDVVGRCGHGLLLLVGIHRDDSDAQVAKMAGKIANLRIFNDDEMKMNLSLADLPDHDLPNVLAVSQFTVYGDVSKSRRPSFTESAPFEKGRDLFDKFVRCLRDLGLRVQTGSFGEHMKVELVNDGPVTLVIDV